MQKTRIRLGKHGVGCVVREVVGGEGRSAGSGTGSCKLLTLIWPTPGTSVAVRGTGSFRT